MNYRRDPLRWLSWYYDIRETPEDLFLAVLARRRAEIADRQGDLG